MNAAHFAARNILVTGADRGNANEYILEALPAQ
jgi:hypothetical protein